MVVILILIVLMVVGIPGYSFMVGCPPQVNVRDFQGVFCVLFFVSFQKSQGLVNPVHPFLVQALGWDLIPTGPPPHP